MVKRKDGTLESSMKKYTTIESWRSDFELFKKHPNNMELIKSIATKVHNSEEYIRKAVKRDLEERTLEVHGELEYLAVATLSASREYTLVIKTKEDPYFEV